MKISKKALALLTSGAIAISTISAVVSRKVKEPYLVDENGMTWLTAKDYDTYTFNKALNEDGSTFNNQYSSYINYECYSC